MYRGYWARSLLSRAIALLVVCLVLAWGAGLFAEAERELTGKMTHEELKAYVNDGAGTAYVERCLAILIGAALFVGVIEALAGGIRLLISAARDDGEPSYTRRGSE